MVEKKRARNRDRADWELLLRQYEAGSAIADISEQTGLSECWISKQIVTLRKDGAEARERYHEIALQRELTRAEAELLRGDADAATKRLRALSLLVRLEKDLKQFIAEDSAAEDNDIDPAAVRAELERRFNRIRESHGLDGRFGCNDGAGTCVASD